MSHRVGEGDRTHFRSDRFYQENGKWFFSTRENFMNGPFDSKKEAEAELTLYMRRLHDFVPSAIGKDQ